MNIGIIVHSLSGFNARIARLLGSAFTAQGHSADMILLRTVGKIAPRSTSFELRNNPDVTEYDCIIVGGPVMGFAASPVMLKYLGGLGRLSGKKVLCYVTKALPLRWTGGNQALAAMHEKLELSDAELLPGEIIWISSGASAAKLQSIVDRMVAACLG